MRFLDECTQRHMKGEDTKRHEETLRAFAVPACFGLLGKGNRTKQKNSMKLHEKRIFGQNT
jgi:hypothetical protein